MPLLLYRTDREKPIKKVFQREKTFLILGCLPFWRIHGMIAQIENAELRRGDDAER